MHTSNSAQGIVLFVFTKRTKSTRSVLSGILSCFYKSRIKCSRKGTFQRLCRLRMLAHTLCVYRCRGAASRRPGKCREAACLLRQQQAYPPQAAEKHAQHAAPTGANFPCNGKFPKGNGFILFASTKRTGSSRRAAALSTPGDASKLYRLCFFVTFPSFVPKLVYGATHFSGCFEPVRKGSCSTDARPIFFENGMSYCKLTGASRIRKG